MNRVNFGSEIHNRAAILAGGRRASQHSCKLKFRRGGCPWFEARFSGLLTRGDFVASVRLSHVAEFQFRYNNRQNADIFGTAIKGC